MPTASLPQPPTTYLKRVYVDTVVFTPYQLAELVRVFGADHVVMGTDYPYDMADFDPVGLVAGGARLRRRDHRGACRRQCQEAAGVMRFCSPDGAERNPGTIDRLKHRSRISLTLHPGYASQI